MGLISTDNRNPYDRRQLTSGTLRVGFQSIQPYPHGHRPLDAVNDKNPVTLQFQNHPGREEYPMGLK